METRKAVIIVLSALTLFGLFCGLLYSINLDLSSDMVVPGLVAMEIVNHHNFQFFTLPTTRTFSRTSILSILYPRLCPTLTRSC
ncbi:MAG: hypothetical protein WBZ29_08340 [Methanocella sp.]